VSEAIIWCVAYLVCLVIVGYGAIVFFAGELSYVESFGIAAVVGPGVTGMILIAASMLGETPGRVLILSISVTFGAANIVKIRRLVPKLAGVRRPTTVEMVICGIALAAVSYGAFVVSQTAFHSATLEWDAYMIWQLKGKVLALHPLIPRPSYFYQVTLSSTHLRYPILVPMISAGVHGMTGRLDDELGKTPFALMYVGLGWMTYRFLRGRVGYVPSAGAAALLMTTPPMLMYAGTGMAEMALIAFYGGSLCFLLRWQEHGRTSDLVLAGIFTALMPWTKDEGIALAAINVLAVPFLRAGVRTRANLIRSIVFVAAVFLFYCPWILYVRGLPQTYENYAQHLGIVEILSNLKRLPEIFSIGWSYLYQWRNWGLLWVILLVTAGLNPGALKSRAVITLWVLLIAHFLAYLPPYMVTSWDLPVLVKFSVGRLILHMTPATAILIGLQWPSGE
jgi:dolichyl-phosphate-mannose-protein mannosyltransferase